ncbi:MAG: ornithine cyclodeaminase family protein [Anaerolineae bacterium]|nr:ornithine cyclodeaminase family protein [Anaerolineae bacterium]
MLILSASDVTRALPMPDCIAAMKSAYSQLSAGEAVTPLRSRVQAEDGTVLVMPAYLQQSHDLGLKVVTIFPDNPAKNLPMIHAAVLVLDAENGQPLALLEGGTLTAIRTGAGSGAATDLLAREDASSVAIIGSGVQAKSHLQAVCAVRQIKRAFVYSRTTSNARAFAAAMAGQPTMPTEIIVSDTPEEAVSQADIICTTTTSSTPVFDGHAIKPGTHINAVGSYTPQMQEVDEVTLQRSLIVVDSREASLAEAGELIIALNNGSITQDSVHAEIGDILNGAKSGRTSSEQITYFKSVGVAAQDAAAASVALRNATMHNLGTVLDFFS